MVDLKSYQDDGAGYQSKAVLAFLQMRGEIEESWNKERKDHDASLQIARWENCREQGYVVMLKDHSFKSNVPQLNIAFFEHRNSDSICAVKWVQHTMNSPTIDTAKFGDIYKDKYDVSHNVDYGKVDDMAKWIHGEFVKHWVENTKQKETI